MIRHILISSFLSASITLSSSVVAYADSADAPQRAVAGDRYARLCQRTPSLSTYGYPGRDNVHRSNKLARPAGKSEFALGQRLYFTGRVFDRACVPLKNAKVEIWHADHAGDYRIADKGDLSNPYPIFAGAGQVHTNNRGEYVFETIMPEPSGSKSAPVINMRVTHPAMRSPLNTVVYFQGEPRNSNDRRYRALSETQKDLVSADLLPLDAEDINNGVRAHIDLTVNARDGFRGF